MPSVSLRTAARSGGQTNDATKAASRASVNFSADAISNSADQHSNQQADQASAPNPDCPLHPRDPRANTPSNHSCAILGLAQQAFTVKYRTKRQQVHWALRPGNRRDLPAPTIDLKFIHYWSEYQRLSCRCKYPQNRPEDARSARPGPSGSSARQSAPLSSQC